MRKKGSPGAFTPAILLAALLFPAASSGSFTGDFDLPPDPAGTVIDREFIWTNEEGLDAVLAILYSRNGTEYVDIVSADIQGDSLEWNLLHTWPASRDGHPLDLALNTVMDSQEQSGRLYFSFIEEIRTYEGKVSIYLCFDTATRSISVEWSD